MVIGKLDIRITIQHYTETTNGFGERVKAWVDYATVWSGLSTKSGGEAYRATEKTSANEVFFTIRYISPLNEKMRIIYDNYIYDITYITEIQRKRGYVISATRKDNNNV